MSAHISLPRCKNVTVKTSTSEYGFDMVRIEISTSDGGGEHFISLTGDTGLIDNFMSAVKPAIEFEERE